MSSGLIGLLFLFWLYLAYRAVQRGDTGMAVVYVIIGVALAAYRLSRKT